MSAPTLIRPPVPPFTRETAIQKVRMAEDGWNSRDPERVSLVYTEDSRWRNRAEFPQGRAEIVQFLKTGRNKHAVVYGSMTEAFNNSTQFMADEDLAAIARYLKSLPGDPQRDGTPWQYQAVSAARLDSPGAHTYVTRCASCHGLDGQGQAEWMPPLAGATSALAKENASAINITLNGSQRVVAAGVPDAYRMPAFREQLSDREIAEVLTFVRGTWGNQGGAVDAQAVGKLRGHTDPASSSPIILHMR